MNSRGLPILTLLLCICVDSGAAGAANQPGSPIAVLHAAVSTPPAVVAVPAVVSTPPGLADPPAAATAASAPSPAASSPAAPRLGERAILRRALAQLMIDPTAGLFRLGDAKSIAPGDHSQQIPTIRAAMIAFGYLAANTPAAADATLYQDPLVGAVKRFQLEVGLQDDGVIGNATRRAMRAMDGNRILMIQQSLSQPEPRQAKRFIVINVAAGLAYAYQDGQPVIVSRVIVGKPSTQTPLFSARIQSVTLNPIWVAPESIVEKEFGGNAHVGKPGPDNPLGKIRIDMPNRFEIFLHSTNQPRFFKHNIRPYSHGCVRVEQIQALAKWLVGDQAWQMADADKALQGLKTVRIPLAETVPIYLQYRTATVSSTGQVIYHADPYMLAAPPPPVTPPATVANSPMLVANRPAPQTKSAVPAPPQNLQAVSMGTLGPGHH
jgi:murein L,D-transpeptidase YcbB/YkuD